MNADCEKCGGACCKGMLFDPSRGVVNADERRWLELHGVDKSTRVMMNRRCEKLVDGKCSIYEFRPAVCKKFDVGGPDCLFAIKTFGHQ